MSYVFLVVCLFFFSSVWLLATSRENYWSDRHDDFATCVSVDKEILTKFLKVITTIFGKIMCITNFKGYSGSVFVPRILIQDLIPSWM